MIFDSHAHYDDEAFNEDREAILNSLPENGISPIVNVSAQLSGVTATVELTEKYPFIYGSVGVHPDHVGELSEEKIQWMKELAGREKIVAVGEIGLDHYWDTGASESVVRASAGTGPGEETSGHHSQPGGLPGDL